MKNLDVFSLEELSMTEVMTIDGGSFWWDAAWIVGVTAKAIYQFGQDAMTYQNSLPANLKK